MVCSIVKIHTNEWSENVKASFSWIQYIMNGIDFMMSLICIDIPTY